MTLQRRIAFFVGLPVLLLVLIAAYAAYHLLKPLDTTKPVEFYVGAKTTLMGAVGQLEERGIVTSALVSKVFARAAAYFSHRTLQRGTYEFPPGMRQYEVIMSLFSHRNLQTVLVTFQEGITLRKYAEIASEKIGCSRGEFFRVAYSDSLREARGLTTATIEGYFMPNTYEFYKKTPAAEVIDKLLDEQDEFWREVETTSTLDLTRHTVLTLASIVEAETPVDDEKPRVAGVYWNRVQRGMKLEADPTVQYVLDIKIQNRTNRRVFYRDLEIDSPFNTYKYAGLPPAPINSPSRSAIRAALAPEKHDFLFFVARLDGTNTHTFTRSADEHMRAVALFRARRRAQN
jgi:UPF0755 protein